MNDDEIKELLLRFRRHNEAIKYLTDTEDGWYTMRDFIESEVRLYHRIDCVLSQTPFDPETFFPPFDEYSDEQEESAGRGRWDRLTEWFSKNKEKVGEQLFDKINGLVKDFFPTGRQS